MAVNTARFIARAQVALAFFYAAGFLCALTALILLPKPIDEGVRTLLNMMLGGLAALVTQQSSYFFARTRTSTTTGENYDPQVAAPADPARPGAA